MKNTTTLLLIFLGLSWFITKINGATKISVACPVCTSNITHPVSQFNFFKPQFSEASSGLENYTHYPKTISATGLFTNIIAKTVDPANYPYELNSPVWSDGARAKRYLILPKDSAVTYVDDTSEFVFPEGAVLVKNLLLDTVQNNVHTEKFIETQLLVYQKQEWHGFSYRWTKDQTEAVLVGGVEGKWEVDTFFVQSALGSKHKKNWLFGARIPMDFYGPGPGLVSCNSCHTVHKENLQPINSTTDSHITLGFRTVQLSRVVNGKDQIQDMMERGYIRKAPGVIYDPTTNFKWFGLEDSLMIGSSLDKRARSYLAANCSHCHRHNNGTTAQVFLQYNALIQNIDLSLFAPSQGIWGMEAPVSEKLKVIYPGKPEFSVLYRRLSAGDDYGYRDTTNYGIFGRDQSRVLLKTTGWPGSGRIQMPPLATYEINPLANRVIYEWIKSLGPNGVSIPANPNTQVPASHLNLTSPSQVHGRFYYPLRQNEKTKITKEYRTDLLGKKSVFVF